MITIILSLFAAFSWGVADFAGGFASRKTGAYRTVFYAAIIGILALFLAVVIVGETLPTDNTWFFAIIAGAFGTTGVLLLYYSMSVGLMSITPPVSALLAAALPIIVTMFREGMPKFTTILGFVFGLFAVWMISQGEGGMKNIITHLFDLKLPVLAGIGFGGYYIFIHEASMTSTYWPIIIARTSGLLLVTLIMIIRHDSWRVQDGSSWGWMAISGVLDVSGLAFFVVASQSGRLDVVAVLGSLFPGITVLAAWLFLKEKVSRNQWVGIFSALIAIILMTV